MAFGLAASRKRKTISRSAPGKNFRFEISLVFLMAALLLATLLLLLSANCYLAKSKERKYAAGASGLTAIGTKNDPPASGKAVLDSASLDFRVTVPGQIGEWFFKTGHIKSPVEDNLSDQYVQIFLPFSEKSGSKNFEDQYKDILTIKKFSSSEWEKLESGCQKGNLLYCETAGSKIEEKGNFVYAWMKSRNCPQELKSKCQLAEKIVGTFTFK